MFYPIGFGGSHWLLYIGVPLIIGIWAQIRVSRAFSRWSKVRASSNITGAECAREILQAAQIHDVEVVETNDFLGDHYDQTKTVLCLSSNVYNTPSVASLILPFVIFGGILFHITGLITLGIYCYAILLVFQLITLPVEFDASRRAKIILQQMGIVQPGAEVAGVNSMLNAAALTYVAAFIAALGNLLWLLSVRDRRS